MFEVFSTNSERDRDFSRIALLKILLIGQKTQFEQQFSASYSMYKHRKNLTPEPLERA